MRTRRTLGGGNVPVVMGCVCMGGGKGGSGDVDSGSSCPRLVLGGLGSPSVCLPHYLGGWAGTGSPGFGLLGQSLTYEQTVFKKNSHRGEKEDE